VKKKSGLVPGLLILFLCQSLVADEIPRRDLEFFEKQIRPVLVKHCYECHSDKAKKAEGGLVLDTREGMLVGGESGAAVVPNKIAQSILIEAIEYKSFEMPPDKKLPDAVIADFRKWVKSGAPDPRDGKMSSMAADQKEQQYLTASDLWSLKPIAKPKPPHVKDESGMESPIDRFIQARLESRNLEPVPHAKPETLLRRVYFDLTGLPPTAKQLQQFLESPSPHALEAIIDKLIATPQFGERWARHWMDVARYAESAGNSRDVLMPHAWRYRDYLVDAVNNDVPFDRFITEQIAGDLLTAETSWERDRLRIATGFLAIGSKSLNGGNLELDIVDEQIDVIGKSILGLTISCARCHDHKFDPIPTKDYYALAGIFKSTDTLYGGGLKRANKPNLQLSSLYVLGEHGAEQMKALQKQEQELAKLTRQEKNLLNRQKKLRKQLPKDFQQRLRELKRLEQARQKQTQNNTEEPADEPDSDSNDKTSDDQPVSQEDQIILEYSSNAAELRSIRQNVDDLKKQKPKYTFKFAVGARDAEKISDSKIHIRGEKNKLGELAPRGFLSAVANSTEHQVNATQSGRLELANWLTDPKNPLTARVAVNRIWMHLFGRGIVNTVDNFGVNGESPTHPELLDYLANRFIELGWSRKALIKELMLTRTYKLSSDYNVSNYEADPANALLWRMSRRRLEAEAIRDAMLAASGELDLRRPHASAVAEIGDGEVGRNLNTKPLYQPFPHRSVYLPIIRGLVPTMLKTFDLPDPSNPQGQRDRTNVPPQSLFMMNNPFVIKRAAALAERALAQSADVESRIQWLYQTCYTRPASSAELQIATQYMQTGQQRLIEENKNSTDSERLAWATYCQALFAAAEFRFLD